MGEITDDFSKYLQLMIKAHESQINAVRDEGDKWKQLYEKEHTVASSLQQQLNVEVERLKKLLNIAESKITEKDKVIAEKDKVIAEKDRALSQLISDSASVNEDSQHNSHPQHDSGTTSPSLLDQDTSLFPAKRTASEDNDVSWNKRKKRRRSKPTNRLKQITLTQHQSSRLSLSLRKTDRSISVIPQSPVIDLSTVSSDEGSDGDTTDEYNSSVDFVNQNLINQDHGTVNDYTTVSQDQGSQDDLNYDTASQNLDNGDSSMKNQDFIPLDQDDSQSQDNNIHKRHNNITANHTNILISQDSAMISQYNLTRGIASQGIAGNQDHGVVHGEANLTNQNQDLDYTFAPEVMTNGGPLTMSQNSTGSQDQVFDQQKENQREQSKTMAGSKYVATVRKRSDRQKLDALPCRECAEWYAGDPSMAKQTCRHRFVHPPVNTPADFWKIGFPDTPAE